MLRSLLASLFVFVLAPASAAPLASLVIKVEKVSSRAGDLRVALYDRTSYELADADPISDKVVPAKPGETVLTMSAIKPGVYAIKMFQDFNRNGKFDMNWFGWPLEKFGFSNNAHPTFSEPPFDATKFDLRPGTNTITIRLQ